MAKAKQWSGGGDWSDTGTFVRKPSTGWIHKDQDLLDGSEIRYRVAYLGCVPISQSMRSLQYNTRTSVTKEAINQIAEKSERILPIKKRKVGKQINKLLGNVDTRNAADVVLHIGVDYLKVTNAITKQVMYKHSLTVISFASGGEGVTEDFIAYVAKKTTNERACHVFYCSEGIAPLVLATVGQAFELRFKQYLKGDRGGGGGGGGGRGGAGTRMDSLDWDEEFSHHLPHDSTAHQRSLPPLPSDPHHDDENPYYSAVPVEPSIAHPHPAPKDEYSHYQRDGVYSFCQNEEGEYSQPCLPSDVPRYETAADSIQVRLSVHKQLPSVPPPLTEVTSHAVARPRVYSDLPGFPQPQPEEVSTTLKGKSQARQSYNPYDTMPLSDGVSTLPPPVPSPLPPPEPPQENSEQEYQLVTIHQQPTAKRFEDQIDLTPAEKQIYSNTHITPEAPRKNKKPQPTRRKDYEDPVSLETLQIRRPSAADYEDPDLILSATKDEPDGGVIVVQDSPPAQEPEFDDPEYDTYNRLRPVEEVKQFVDPLAPLTVQPYFHGRIPRPNAEGLVLCNGDYLVRESTNKPGQYVLTGRSSGAPQHLLLIDKNGRVKSRDREFDSIPHLVQYFSDNVMPLIINGNDVFLSNPIPNH